MNFITLLTLIVSVLGLLSAEKERKPSHCITKKCTRELEEIVYQPSTYYREYLDKISTEIKIAGPFILWSNEVKSFIAAFEAKYNVNVVILNPFRNDFLKQIINDPNYYSTTSIANMNGSGYALNSIKKQRRALLEFIVFNPDGDLKYVIISLYISNDQDK